MKNQGLSPIAPAVVADEAAPSPVLTNGHHNGFEELRAAFAENRPVALVFGESKFRPDYLIERFLADCEDDVAKVRIPDAGSDVDDVIRDVARAAGFDLQDVNSVGLVNEFRNFLSHQKHNGRRTVICFEEVDNDSRQVLDIALRLADLEVSENLGLMLVLSGPPDLNDLLSESQFDELRALVGQPIALVPFSLEETRGHILRAVATAGFSDFSRVFEYDAITCIHEICAGVPDRVEALCCECIETAAEKGAFPVTAELAIAAAGLSGQEQVMHAQADAPRVNGAKAPIGRLIARMHGVVVKEHVLLHGHILIGRGPLCDIPLTNPLVSRHHALVVNAETGVSLVDLGSTNGTFIDGSQIDQHALQHGDVITVGDCEISYEAYDD